jgi:TonB family protein
MLLRFTAIVLLAGALSGRFLAADTSKTKEENAKIYEIGPDIQPPKLVHVVDPEFDPKSEEAFTSGVVRMQIVVTTEGNVKDPKVVSGLNERQNSKAIEAVKKWRFKPALHQDKPVNVKVTVEVNFHLL